MKRALVLGFAFCLAVGCTVPGDRVVPKVLVDDGQPRPYAELLTRARQQSTASIDALYVNRWGELDELAQGLEQTAKFLTKATDVPEKNKVNLTVVAGDLGKAAVALGEAAKAQDAKKVREALNRVQDKVYELRLEN